MDTTDSDIPTTVFIVPYRDRERDKTLFLKIIPRYIEVSDCCKELRGKYKIFFSHQCDTRPFNRGATKNIGFLAIKKLYPQHYKDITFIFHDVDTYPKQENIIPYKTTPGVVSHYYGATFALGGMFAIKGADFEKANGFPCFWGWGLEDNEIQKRCLNAGLTIDRSIFYKMRDLKNILRSNDGIYRTIAKRDVTIYKFEKLDGLNEIKELNWNIDDNMINITSFETLMDWKNQQYQKYDISKQSRMVVQKGTFRRDWSLDYIYKKK